MKILQSARAKRVLKWLRELASKTVLGYISKLVIGVLILATPPEKIYAALQGRTYNLLTQLWLLLTRPWRIELSILQILAFLLLALFAYQTLNFVNKWRKSKKVLYYFREEEELLWKVGNNTQKVEESPYCPTHKAKLGIFETTISRAVGNVNLPFVLQCPYGHDVTISLIHPLDEIHRRVQLKVEAEQ